MGLKGVKIRRSECDKGTSARLDKDVGRMKIWLTSRTECGAQLVDADQLIEGYDYFGDEPWKERIASSVFLAQFIHFNGGDYNLGELTTIIGRAAPGLVMSENKVCLMVDHRGEIEFRKRRQIYSFEPLDMFKARFEIY